jgi:hypothetical protein
MKKEQKTDADFITGFTLEQFIITVLRSGLPQKDRSGTPRNTIATFFRPMNSEHCPTPKPDQGVAPKRGGPVRGGLFFFVSVNESGSWVHLCGFFRLLKLGRLLFFAGGLKGSSWASLEKGRLQLFFNDCSEKNNNTFTYL